MRILSKTLGDGDEDVMNFRAGIGGLVFEGWTDEKIAEIAVEEAKASRDALEDVMNAARAARGGK